MTNDEQPRTTDDTILDPAILTAQRLRNRCATHCVESVGFFGEKTYNAVTIPLAITRDDGSQRIVLRCACGALKAFEIDVHPDWRMESDWYRLESERVG